MLENADHHLPDHVVSFPRRQYKLNCWNLKAPQDPVYKTNSMLDLMLASKAAQMVSTFTHSLQYVQLLSTFGGCFHY